MEARSKRATDLQNPTIKDAGMRDRLISAGSAAPGAKPPADGQDRKAELARCQFGASDQSQPHDRTDGTWNAAEAVSETATGASQREIPSDTNVEGYRRLMQA